MDLTLRTVCRMVVDCRAYLSERPSGDLEVSAWRRRRLFRARGFAADDFEDFTEGKRKTLRAEVVDWWWGPGSEVFVSYSSKGAVARLGQVNDAGRCLDCGGIRRAPACSCRA
jgi:hypothetical protein